MKKLLSLLLCLALALSLAACGGTTTPTEPPTEPPTAAPTTEPTVPPTEPPTEPPVTVKDVYYSIANAMKDTEVTKLKMALNFGVNYTETVDEEEVTTEIDYGMAMEMVISGEPFGTFNTATISVNTQGFDMDITVDGYTVVEDGTVVNYINALGMWSRSDSGLSVEDYLKEGNAEEISTSDFWTGGELPADATLDPFTQNLDGTEVYILRATVMIPGLNEALSEMGVGLTEEIDELPLPVVYYADTQDYTIRRVEVDMQGVMDILADSMSQSITGEDADVSGLKVTITDTVYELGYGPQEVPALPQEALDQAYEDPTEDPTEEPTADLPIAGKATDLGNGVFVLPCGDEAFTITCPEDWEGEVYSDDNIWIYDEDISHYGDFYYFPNLTETDLLNQIQSDADDMKANDIFISSGDGPVREGYTTMAVLGKGESYCYAWKPAGEGYLVMILGDFTDTPDLEALMDQMLDSMEPYTGQFAEDTGVFTLPCGDQVLTIACPEGWSGELFEYNNVWIYNQDETIYCDYFYLEDWTEEDILNDWVQPDVDSLTTNNNFVSQGDGPACEGYTTKVVIGEGVSYYYAWKPMGDGYFLVYIYDFDGGDHSAQLVPQLLDIVTSNAAE